MSEPIDELFSTPGMSTIFSSEAHVRAMLAFEAALARSEASAGIIPQEAADAIVASCREELLDVAALYREAATAGTPAIPLVRMLMAQVEGDAQKFVHWGATSQDAIDTALMLQIREGLDLLMAGLLSVCAVCATLAEQHRRTPMVGRTLLQQALPITFGLKAARWLALATRLVRTLRECRDRELVVQLGGAAGTLASLRDRGFQVVELLAGELRLSVPELPWHTERDRIARIATALGIVAGAMAKIAGDVALLAQTEVGEVAEGPLRGREDHPRCHRNAIRSMLLVRWLRPGWQLDWCRCSSPQWYRSMSGPSGDGRRNGLPSPISSASLRILSSEFGARCLVSRSVLYT